MTDREKLMDRLKSFNVQPPSAGTIVRTSGPPPAQGPVASPARRADFFFRGRTVETPGSGNLMAGNPRAKPLKAGRK